jgi:hypothetical protein
MGRFISMGAVGLLMAALSAACSPATYFSNTKQASVDYCIKKSCAGPSVTEARDYQRCEATCRERFGQ